MFDQEKGAGGLLVAWVGMASWQIHEANTWGRVYIITHTRTHTHTNSIYSYKHTQYYPHKHTHTNDLFMAKRRGEKRIHITAQCRWSLLLYTYLNLWQTEALLRTVVVRRNVWGHNGGHSEGDGNQWWRWQWRIWWWKKDHDKVALRRFTLWIKIDVFSHNRHTRQNVV